MKKQYLEIEHIKSIVNLLTVIFNDELENESLAENNNFIHSILAFKRCYIEVMIYKNGIVKYNFQSPKNTLYTITHKHLLKQLKVTYRE